MNVRPTEGIKRARAKRRERIARARAQGKALVKRARARADQLLATAFLRGDQLVALAQARAQNARKSLPKKGATKKMNLKSEDGSKNVTKFLAAMRTVAREEPAGGLLSVRAVRAAAALPKEEFDEIALKLARDGRVVLHYHDFPASLRKTQRDALIKDPKGIYYVGIAFPREILRKDA